jgi:endothelin-converting enzyme/putative endopeptidase
MGIQQDLDKLNKPVDKTRWYMSQTVNAYYNPAYNEIVSSSYIASAFNYQADEAVNYGGIGAVIGCKSSHGFDDLEHVTMLMI